jgi:predicted dithiol-disulfide oxidoreductase (DUF899 family)
MFTDMPTNTLSRDHEVVSRDEWIAARKELLKKEKELTRQRDELSRRRRDLPWVKVEERLPLRLAAGEGHACRSLRWAQPAHRLSLHVPS